MDSFDNCITLTKLRKEDACSLQISFSYINYSDFVQFKDVRSLGNSDRSQQSKLSLWKQSTPVNVLHHAKQFNGDCLKLAKSCLFPCVSKSGQSQASGTCATSSQNATEKESVSQKKIIRKSVLTNFDINALSPNSW